MVTDNDQLAKRRAAFLLLDGLELDTIEYFRAEGVMPNFDRLWKAGRFQAMASRDTYSAEATPTEMITGQSAEDTGYFGLIDFDPDTYLATNVGSYLGPGFYDRDDVRSIVFDCPHMQVRDSPGIHVAAWGCHSAQYPRASSPANVIVDIEQKFGTQHTPEFEDLHSSHNLKWGQAVTDHIMESLVTRPKIVDYLMELEPDWDLLIIGSTEAHMHEHAFHHSVDPSHPLFGHADTPAVRQFMRTLFIGIDTMVAEIEALLPEDAVFMIGAVHGAKPSAIDSSAALIAELTYRDQTGDILLDMPIHLDAPVPLDEWQRARGYMQRHLKRPGKPALPGAKEALLHYVRWGTHRYLPGKPEWWLELASRKLQGQTRLWWTVRKPEPLNEPLDISDASTSVPIVTEPSNWYKDAWPSMRFFVMPSFSGLQFRVNLQGRESNGLVKADDYEKALDEIQALLDPITDAVTGEKVVTNYWRPRLGDPCGPGGTGADFVVTLNAATTISHPEHGMIGTIPYARVAEHSERGWMLATGVEMEGDERDIANTIDVATTLLSLIGKEPEDRLKGQIMYRASQERVDH